MSTPNLWTRYQQYLCGVPALGLTLDVSRMRFEDDFLERMALPLRQAFEAMDDLERGGVANPDEKRMVGTTGCGRPTRRRRRRSRGKSARPWPTSKRSRPRCMTAPSAPPPASPSRGCSPSPRRTAPVSTGHP
jgi:hypothetical protein